LSKGIWIGSRGNKTSGQRLPFFSGRFQRIGGGAPVRADRPSSFRKRRCASILCFEYSMAGWQIIVRGDPTRQFHYTGNSGVGWRVLVAILKEIQRASRFTLTKEPVLQEISAWRDWVPISFSRQGNSLLRGSGYDEAGSTRGLPRSKRPPLPARGGTWAHMSEDGRRAHDQPAGTKRNQALARFSGAERIDGDPSAGGSRRSRSSI